MIPLSPLAHERARPAARRRAVRRSARAATSRSAISAAARRGLDALIARQRAEARLGRRVEPRGAAGSRRRAAAVAACTICAGPSRPACSAWACAWRSSRPCSGTFRAAAAGIVGVYQRHRFEAEAREALVAWGAHVQRLIDGDVTRRRGRAAAPRIEFPSWGRLGLAAESGFRSHPPAAPSHPRTAPADGVRRCLPTLGCRPSEFLRVGKPVTRTCQTTRRRYPSGSRPVSRSCWRTASPPWRVSPRRRPARTNPRDCVAADQNRIPSVRLQRSPVRDGRQGARKARAGPDRQQDVE